MKDLLYQILNNNSAELPPSERISDKEAEDIMKRFRKDKNERTSRSFRRPRLSVILIAAVVTAGCIGTATVGAAKFGVFSGLNSTQKQTFEWNGTTLPIDKYENRYDYDSIADNAENMPELLKAEGDNLSAKVEEVYCDGCTTIISLSGSLKDGNPDGKHLLKFVYFTIDVNGETYENFADPKKHPAWVYGEMKLEEGNTNKFSGTIQLINFGGKEIKEPATLNIKVAAVRELAHYMDDSAKESSGFSLSVPVVPNASLRHRKELTVEENGFAVRVYEVSPAMMIVGFRSDEKFSCGLFDENGSSLKEFFLTDRPDYVDGFEIRCFQPVGAGKVTARFWDKSCKHGMPDESGIFPPVSELELDINEIYADVEMES